MWHNAMHEIHLAGLSSREVVCHALEQVAPVVECRRVRVAGATLEVPALVTPQQARGRGLRWILKGARRRRGMSASRALALEFMEAARGGGWAVTQRVESSRLAEANRANIRYQWWT